MTTYSASELDEILRRHRQADRRPHLISLALYTLLGAVFGFLAAGWING